MKYYRVRHCHNSEAFFEVEKIEVIRETTKFVYLENRKGFESKESKESRFTNYFPTMQLVEDWCKERRNNGIKTRSENIKRLSDGLVDMKNAKAFIIKTK